jgi:hypothetical protein
MRLIRIKISPIFLVGKVFPSLQPLLSKVLRYPILGAPHESSVASVNTYVGAPIGDSW